ncbi:hypothetical protein B0J18DRAFT_435839 [Chaetomium sp. MPI-SDFR-AT-0129]|uniref:Uncharacterized protein n=1 Tax=Dichotomopilus funicola TaxID=1934379 RepID=A0AAN6V6A3_9PEZI|nr:hypothetical protein B0J18DRAFT_435839 [Chaetomium sp. MPI-SDFR-AT-0129]KAK4145249.1 hypothetical protein C8A04DRAFT_35963 [Dichotomopilus funicola]
MPGFRSFFRRPRRLAPCHNGLETDDNGASSNNEKCSRCPRDWSAIFLTALRLLQFTYFAFAYYSLHGLWRSGYFHQDGQGRTHHERRMMRWIRMQASMTLIYHAGALVVPWLLRLLKATKRPFTSLVAVFADGCAMMTLLSMLVMLDTSHEGFCHGASPIAEFDLRDMFHYGEGGSHYRSSHRFVCQSLDVVFGLGGLIVLSYFVTAVTTARRAKRDSCTVAAKVEPPHDIEQGISEPARREVPDSPVTPSRRHSPPPSYHSVVPEPAQERPDPSRRRSSQSLRSRASMETTSSIGLERYGYVVSDGWRAPEQPPMYSSRPPSLRHVEVQE